MKLFHHMTKVRVLSKEQRSCIIFVLLCLQEDVVCHTISQTKTKKKLKLLVLWLTILFATLFFFMTVFKGGASAGKEGCCSTLPIESGQMQKGILPNTMRFLKGFWQEFPNNFFQLSRALHPFLPSSGILFKIKLISLSISYEIIILFQMTEKKFAVNIKSHLDEITDSGPTALWDIQPCELLRETERKRWAVRSS